MVTPGPGPRVSVASLARATIACAVAIPGMFEQLPADDAELVASEGAYPLVNRPVRGPRDRDAWPVFEVVR